MAAIWPSTLVCLGALFLSLPSFGANTLVMNQEGYSNLPLVHIQTQAPVPEVKDVKVQGTVQFLDRGINYFADLATVPPVAGATLEVRGQSSAAFAKKQYNLEFFELGKPESEKKLAFLDLPEHSNWVLAAPYFDPTLIRNRLAFWLSNFMYRGEGEGWFAPKTRAFELFLNGTYKGIYVLTEKIDGSKNRINLKKIKIEERAKHEFIVRVDPIAGKTADMYFYTPLKIPVSYYEPKAKKLKQYYEQSPEHGGRLYQHITGTLADFEQAIFEMSREAVPRYRELIDANSFINYILIQEVFKNIDGFRRSVYLTYKNGKLSLSPPWDFDLALGNLIVYGQDWPQGFQIGRGSYPDGNHEIPWFAPMLKDPWFSEQLIQTYKLLRQAPYVLSNEVVLGAIDHFTSELNMGAQQRNFSLWDPNGSPRDGPVFYAIPKHLNFRYSKVVSDLKEWLAKRLEWLDRHIEEIADR